MKKKAISTAIGASLITVAVAASFQASADAYDVSLSYGAGSVVTYAGKTFRAKWHANVGQSPADVAHAANPWDSPWELVSDGGDPVSPGENQAPTVKLTSPGNGAIAEEGNDIVLSATAVDADGAVAKVEFYTGNQLLGSVTAAPFTLAWSTAMRGSHTLTAVATDNKKATTTSIPVVLKVIGEGEQPGDTYDASLSYGPGCIVTFNGEYFRAKWHANPGQSPADVGAGDPWSTPWERTTETTSGCNGTEEPGNPGSGDPEILPIVQIPLSRLRADEQRLTTDPLMQQVKASIRTLDNVAVSAVAPGRAENPANVKRVEAILDNAGFEYVFPMRAPEYTYRGLLQAFAKFPAICATYDDGRDSEAICRKTLATMFAHFAQETGGHEAWRPLPEWRQALVHVREMGWDETMLGGYNGECAPSTWQGKAWPCGTFESGAFKSYFGRGAKQLSYNYNYGPFSEAMFGTVRTLLDKPELVADTWLNLASATFFFSYPQPPKPSMLHVIDGTWAPNAHDLAIGLVPGFGVTTQIINGGVECGGSAEHGQSVNRIAYYREFAKYLNVPVPGNEVLGCKGMQQFDESGAGALPVYWENDYSWVAENPGGKSYACKLVGYQTAFSALKEHDYELCVPAHFDNVRVIDDIK